MHEEFLVVCLDDTPITPRLPIFLFVPNKSIKYFSFQMIFRSDLEKYSIVLEDCERDKFLSKEGAKNPLWLSLACHYIILHYSTMTVEEISEKVPADLPGYVFIDDV